MSNRMSKVVVLAVVGLFCCGVGLDSVSSQNQEPSKEGIEFFEKKIRPILEENCLMCHGAAGKPQGNLRLDSREGMLKGGASGQPAVVPGDVEKSMLIKAIRYTDAKLQMPPVEKLKDPLIADFEEWIKMGAPDPRVKKEQQQSSNNKASDMAAAREFWSFKPVTDPRVPNVRNKTWARTSVDHFILAKFDEKSVRPVRTADKRTLIRRASFDLTGLPPTPEELDAFLADTSPQAFAKVVDRLLASPRYGERWGRHWLDLVRYADTAGDNSDFPIKAAYRFRDYVIKAFNEDKPYDQFIREQIAGDLLPAKDEADRNEKIVATGYLALSRRFGSRNKEFNLTIDDTIDNLGRAILGLSTSCARCHDHKFDPILAKDYYALYGIFNSSRYSFPGAEIYPHPADMVPLASGKQREDFEKWQRQLSDLDDKKEQLTAEKGIAARNRAQKEKDAKAAAEKATASLEKPQENQGARPQSDAATQKAPVVPPVEARTADYDRDAMNWSIPKLSTRTDQEIDAEMASVKARIAELGERNAGISKAYAVVDGRPANARIHRKGDPKNLDEEVPRGFLEVLGGQKVPAECKSSGRDHLAGWLTDVKNPLTARVMVNRIWSWHFGKGLVSTPNDFGSRGDRPTNPELLDHLASQFVKSGYSIKAMHRLIMNSHVYQLAAVTDPRNVAIDAGNNYFWKFDRRRLSAEEIRDAMLAVSGGLDLKPGAEHPFPPERDWKYTQHKQFFAVYATNKRSVYLMQQRLKKHPLMEVFDGPDTNAPTPSRTASTTPVQALYLMNDPFVHAQSDLLAVRVGLAFESLRERINYAYQLAYGRPATAEEQKLGADYLSEAKIDLNGTEVPADRRTRAALSSYMRVLLSSNEFLYVE
jgi:Protein of unknown function (DUF1553)/Protein of unknown function (DUF1549)/Planctomycete cytochrome C